MINPRICYAVVGYVRDTNYRWIVKVFMDIGKAKSYGHLCKRKYLKLKESCKNEDFSKRDLYTNIYDLNMIMHKDLPTIYIIEECPFQGIDK